MHEIFPEQERYSGRVALIYVLVSVLGMGDNMNENVKKEKIRLD